jgi:hypothetical protein
MPGDLGRSPVQPPAQDQGPRGPAGPRAPCRPSAPASAQAQGRPSPPAGVRRSALRGALQRDEQAEGRPGRPASDPPSGIGAWVKKVCGASRSNVKPGHAPSCWGLTEARYEPARVGDQHGGVRVRAIITRRQRWRWRRAPTATQQDHRTPRTTLKDPASRGSTPGCCPARAVLHPCGRTRRGSRRRRPPRCGSAPRRGGFWQPPNYRLAGLERVAVGCRRTQAEAASTTARPPVSSDSPTTWQVLGAEGPRSPRRSRWSPGGSCRPGEDPTSATTSAHTGAADTTAASAGHEPSATDPGRPLHGRDSPPEVGD